MKQIVTTISWSILSFLSGLFSTGSRNPIDVSQIKSPVASPSAYMKTQEVKNPIQVEYSEVNYDAYWVKVGKAEDINLFPNFKEKLTSSVIVDNKKCKTLTSGSFYSKEGKSLGLFCEPGMENVERLF